MNTGIIKRPSIAKLCQKDIPGNIPSLIRLTQPVQTRLEISTSRRPRSPRIVRFLMVLKKQNSRKREQQKAPNGIPI